MKGFEHIIKTFYEEHGLVRHHVASVNKFLESGLQAVVDEVGGFVPAVQPEGVKDYRINFGKISIGQPVIREADGSSSVIYPSEARIRDITYSAPIILELIAERDGIKSEPQDTEVGRLPIMLRSSSCMLSKLTREQMIEKGEDPDDPGGYFIINGTERVLIAIEDLRPNVPILEKKDTGPATDFARLFSEGAGFRVPHLFERFKDGTIRVTFARITRIPVGVLLMALGKSSDEAIMKTISLDDSVAEDMIINIESIEDEIQTTEDALDWIGRQMRIGQGKEYRVERVAELLDQYLLPHIGKRAQDRAEKAAYVGKISEKLILLSRNILKEDDKDHYANKRLKLSGELMEQLFRASFKALLNDMKYSFERITKRGREPPISTIVRSQLLTQRMESAFATGYWVGGRTGVSQHLQRLNHMDTLSHLRRVLSPLTTSQPHFEARELHPTHWGKLCASETPEGQNIGLRKNLAITAKVTQGSDSSTIEKMLTSLGVE